MEVIEFFEKNYAWLFSGAGVTILLVIFGLIKSKESTNKTNQKHIRAGRDVVGRDKRGS